LKSLPNTSSSSKQDSDASAGKGVRRPKNSKSPKPKPTSGDANTSLPASPQNQSELSPEAIMLQSFESLLDSIADERSCVQAAVKLLDSLSDNSMPESIKDKLRDMERKAFSVITQISRFGEVAAARNSANAYLLKHLKTEAPDAWPPDTEATKWKKDYEAAVAAVKV